MVSQNKSKNQEVAVSLAEQDNLDKNDPDPEKTKEVDTTHE